MIDDTRFAIRGLAPAALLAAGLAVAGAAATARADTVPVGGHFVGEGKAAGAGGQIKGHVNGSFDTGSDVLSYTIRYSGLSGPVVAAHFHGPAAAGVSAGVLQPISTPYDSPIKGQVTLTADQAADLTKGLVYVNLHTGANPTGEARAQLHLVRHRHRG